MPTVTDEEICISFSESQLADCQHLESILSLEVVDSDIIYLEFVGNIIKSFTKSTMHLSEKLFLF